jgi:CheY-like chemotaxis protein
MNASQEPTGPGRILVVEDDPDTARYLVEVLQQWGAFDVTHTADPAEALSRAGENWDLVLTDVHMPGMTGLELLESLRQVVPGLPVAVLTAYATVNNVVIALRSRADEFLQKPVLPDKLLATATALVEKGRAARRAGREAVLAIGAHADDVAIGAAGALAAHHDLGHDVAILTLSRGAKDGQEERRAAESEAAARILGATLYLDDLDDGRISEGDPTISLISDVVAAVRPTMVAIRTIGRVYCYQPPSATVDFRPTRFVSIDRQLDRKLEAIGTFGPQSDGDTELDLIQALARSWSRFADGRYAEAFEVIRDRTDMAAGQAAHAPHAQAGVG